MFNQGIPKDKEKLFWISSFDIFVLCFVTWQPYTRLTPIISTWFRKWLTHLVLDFLMLTVRGFVPRFMMNMTTLISQQNLPSFTSIISVSVMFVSLFSNYSRGCSSYRELFNTMLSSKIALNQSLSRYFRNFTVVPQSSR